MATGSREQRNNTIRDQVKNMMVEKSRRGVRMYKESYIYDYVADQWGLAAETVRNIWKVNNKDQ